MGSKAGAIAVPAGAGAGGRIKRIVVGAVVAAAAAGGVAGGVLATHRSAPRLQSVAIDRQLSDWYGGLNSADREALVESGYTGRLGAAGSTGSAGAAGASEPDSLLSWYAQLTPQQIDGLIEAGYTGRLGS
jgi:hypothetical protein